MDFKHYESVIFIDITQYTQQELQLVCYSRIDNDSVVLNEKSQFSTQFLPTLTLKHFSKYMSSNIYNNLDKWKRIHGGE